MNIIIQKNIPIVIIEGKGIAKIREEPNLNNPNTNNSNPNPNPNPNPNTNNSKPNNTKPKPNNICTDVTFYWTSTNW